MKPTTTTLGFGGALFAAALLVACGGGSGGGSATLPNTVSPSGPVASGQSGSTTITIQVPPRRTTQNPHSTRRRDYVSYAAGGLQVAVTAGGVTQTVYANIVYTSPLCSPGTQENGGETCTIAVPNVGASETIVATEVNETPLPATPAPADVRRARAVSTPGPAYGSGFPVGSAILAVGTTSVSLAGSTQQVTVGLNPVVGGFFDCGSETSNANFGVDDDNHRIIVTAGVLASGSIQVGALDPAGYGMQFFTPSPLPSGATAVQPFVDVNGSATPITVSANSMDVGVAIQPSPNTVTPAPFQQSLSIADDRNLWYNCVWLLDVSVSASLPTPAPGVTPTATITFANNLTAALPSGFTGSSYSSSFPYSVVPIYALPSVVTVSASGSAATVTGTDYLGDMGAESAYSGSTNSCLGSGGLVTLTPQPYSNGQTKVSVATSATTTGTCTFYMFDPPSGVVTNQITVNYGP
jgi:hypothetical protein